MSPFKQFTEKSLTCFFRVGSTGSEISIKNSIPINPSARFSSDGSVIVTSARLDCFRVHSHSMFARRACKFNFTGRRSNSDFNQPDRPTDRNLTMNPPETPVPVRHRENKQLKISFNFFIALLVATNNSNYPRAKKILSPVTFNFFPSPRSGILS